MLILCMSFPLIAPTQAIDISLPRCLFEFDSDGDRSLLSSPWQSLLEVQAGRINHILMDIHNRRVGR